MMDSDAIIAIVGTIAFFSVPIVWILTVHQRKMAEIIHRGRGNASDSEALASELRELRQAVHQQTIAMDSLSSDIRNTLQAPPREPLAARLTQDQTGS